MNPEFLALSLIILLFSVIVHEVMHGVAALHFGDETALKMGRLTLNPIPHIDLVGTILVPALFILPAVLYHHPIGIFLAWAKPVPVNPLNFSNLKRGELVVSAAGILANFGLALIAAVLFHLLNTMTSTPQLILEVLSFGVSINLMLGVFNLLPIPPLDGSKVLMSQLPYNLARGYERLEQYGFLILIILLFTGIPQTILGIVVSILSKILGF